MRKILKYTSVIAILLLLSSFAKYYMAKASVLEMSGYILFEDKKVEGAIVKLYQNNVIVNKLNTKINARFKFLLFSENEYMIEVSKEGMMDSRIYINTKNNGFLDDKYYFEFIVDMLDASKYKNIDASDLDFPTAIIKYDAGEDEYVHDIAYTSKVKKDLKRMNDDLNNKK